MSVQGSSATPGVRLATGSRHALERHLADHVEAQRATDPLAPLPIVVGGTLLRPYLRRRLAELAGAHLNVQLMTVGELGLRLGHRRLVAAGRRPLPFLGDRVLAHQVALDCRGYFEPVAGMPRFPTVLLRTLRELRAAGLTADAFAAGVAQARDPTGKLAALAALYRDHEQRRAGFFSSEDGLLVADPAELGASRLLVHGVWDPSASLLTALDTIASALEVTILLPRACEATERFVHWAFAHGADLEAMPEPDRPATQLKALQEGFSAPDDGSVLVVSAPDPTREAAETVRACVRWADEGIPFHEMAVVYRQGEPYRPLLEAAFRDADVPAYLHEGTPLTERPLGRRIAALLALVDSGLDRSTVMAFLSDARLPTAIWERYGRVSPVAWDTLSRRAGIVQGIDQWNDRLAGQRADLEARFAEDPAPWLEDRMEQVDQLQAFVNDLHARLQSRPATARWPEHLRWLRDLLTTYVDDAEPVVDALDGLATLDSLSDPLPFERFHESVVAAIEGLRAADVLDAQTGAFGTRGVAILDANSARHLGFTAVAIVGVAERRFPPPPRQDALVLDEERRALNRRQDWAIPLRALGGDPEPLQYELAVAAADQALQLSVPRTPDGETRPVLPSTFLRGSVGTLSGASVSIDDFERFVAERGRRVPAGRLSPLLAEEALSATEYVRALLESGAPAGAALLRHRLPRSDRVRAAEDAHWTGTLGPHDGALSPELRPLLAAHEALTAPLAPSRIEEYAHCPQKFFLGRILRLRHDDEPERVLQITALERGTLVHAILERFMRGLDGRSRAPTIARASAPSRTRSSRARRPRGSPDTPRCGSVSALPSWRTSSGGWRRNWSMKRAAACRTLTSR